MTTQAAARQDLARSGLRRPGGGVAMALVPGWPAVPTHPPAATLARGVKAAQRAVQLAGRGTAGRLFPPPAEIRNRPRTATFGTDLAHARLHQALGVLP